MSKSVNQSALEQLLGQDMGAPAKPSKFDKEWLDAPPIGKEFPGDEDKSSPSRDGE